MRKIAAIAAGIIIAAICFAVLAKQEADLQEATKNAPQQECHQVTSLNGTSFCY